MILSAGVLTFPLASSIDPFVQMSLWVITLLLPKAIEEESLSLLLV